MNIYIRELKQKLTSAGIWSLSITLLYVLYMSVFSAFSQSSDMIDMVMKNYPKELLQAFGISGVDLGTVEGYFAMAMLFAQIFLAIQASIYGLSILSEEERVMTADFLLTKPVRRTRIYIAKTSAAVSVLVMTFAVVWGSAFLSIEAFRAGKEYDPTIVVKMLSAVILFQLFFLSLGMLISVMLKKIRNVLSYAMGLSFGMYLISAVGSMVGDKVLGYITPFKYFEPNALILNGGYDPIMVMICCAVILVSFAGSYMLYKRRNIHSAV